MNTGRRQEPVLNNSIKRCVIRILRAGAPRLAAVCLLLGFVCTVCAPARVLAQEPHGHGTIDVTAVTTDEQHAALKGLHLSLYQVAEGRILDETVHLTDDFADCGVKIPEDLITDPEGSRQRLEKVARKSGASPLEEETADSSGHLAFTSLEDGVYLVLQTNTEEDYEKLGYRMSAESFVVADPYLKDDGTSIEWVHCQPKCSMTTLSIDMVSVEVEKHWKDDSDKAGRRPAYIKVGLYRDHTLEETVTLSASNNWRHVWEKLDAKIDWSVQEISVPEGYSSSVSGGDHSYVITNTYKADTHKDSPGTTKTSSTGNGGKSAKTVKTGDEVSTVEITLLAALLIVSAAGIWMLLRENRKNRKTR